MIVLAYSCLLLGIPLISIPACLAFDGTPWPGRLLYIVPLVAFASFVLLILQHARRRRATHLVVGVILLPVMWLVTVAAYSGINRPGKPG